MSGSVNKVQLIGNLGRDPEIKTTQAGKTVANLSIATSETWKDKNTGEKREKTEWHRVVIWNEGLVKLCEKYIKKGSKIYVEGQLQTRKWQDKNNQDRYTTEVVLQGFQGHIVLLGSKNGGSSDEDSGSDERGPSSKSNSKSSVPFDDEIPF